MLVDSEWWEVAFHESDQLHAFGAFFRKLVQGAKWNSHEEQSHLKQLTASQLWVYVYDEQVLIIGC